MHFRSTERAIRYALGILSTVLSITSSDARAASQFASPNGSGTTCSQAVPCTASTAINQAQPGDTVILLDGNYNTTITTVRAGTSGNPREVGLSPLGRSLGGGLNGAASWT